MPATWNGIRSFSATRSGDDLTFDERDSAPFVPKCVVVDSSFDWTGPRLYYKCPPNTRAIQGWLGHRSITSTAVGATGRAVAGDTKADVPERQWSAAIGCRYLGSIPLAFRMVAAEGPVMNLTYEAAASGALKASAVDGAVRKVGRVQAMSDCIHVELSSANARVRETLLLIGRGAASTAYLGVEHRKNPRQRFDAEATIWLGRSKLGCTVRDFSPAGVGLSLPDAVSLPGAFELTFDRATRHCIVVWRQLGRVGMKFRSTAKARANSPVTRPLALRWPA
jgi:hypothetical protein